MRMNVAIDLLWPAIRDCVIAPGTPCTLRWLLKDEQIIPTPSRAIALAWAQLVPGDQVDTLTGLVDDAQVLAGAQPERIDPAHEVAGRPQYAHDLAAARIDVVAAHCR